MQVLEVITLEIDGQTVMVERLENGTFRKPDYLAGAEREVIGDSGTGRKSQTGRNGSDTVRMWGNEDGAAPITAPATDAAKRFSGYGTALKPASEIIVMAMKPVENGYANNALVHGVAGLNVDGCRIPANGIEPHATPGSGTLGRHGIYGSANEVLNSKQVARAEQGLNPRYDPQGRWPSNVLLDEESARLLDEQSGERKSGAIEAHHQRHTVGGNGVTLNDMSGVTGPIRDASSGGASRYFQVIKDDEEQLRFAYVAKASSSERNEGLQGMEKRTRNSYSGAESRVGKVRSDGAIQHAANTTSANGHPTVKPIELMRWLCRLTKTPWGGVVLDPFCGSGSTGVAAVLEGRSFIGIDISAEYLPIAEARLAAASAQPFLFEVT